MRHKIPQVNRKFYRLDKQVRRKPVVKRAEVLLDHYQKKSEYSNKKLKIIITFIASVFAVQAIFQVPQFRLQKIIIHGLSHVSESDIRMAIADALQEKRLIVFKNDNFWLFNGSKLSNTLDAEFFTEVIDIKKNFPHTLTINVRERISVFVRQTPEAFFLMDTKGETLHEISSPAGDQVLIADERADTSAPVALDFLEKATTVLEYWQSTIQGLQISAFHFSDEFERLTITTDQGWQIYLDYDDDVQKQIQRLKLFLEDTVIESPREYLDLRFDDNLYLK